VPLDMYGRRIRPRFARTSRSYLLGLDPDQGSGALEVVIVLVFAIVAIVLAIGALMNGRRLRALTE